MRPPTRLYGGAVLLLALLPGAPVMAGESLVYDISISEPGVYGVRFEQLGIEAPLRSAGLGLRHRGEPWPIDVHDGGDGELGPGDWIELIGEQLSGGSTFYDEHTRVNVYQLSLTGGGARFEDAVRPASPPGPLSDPWVREHIEEEHLLLRFAARGGETPDPWYWAKLTFVDPEPFRIKLDLRDLEAAEGRSPTLRIGLRGWSHATKGGAEIAEHRVEVAVGGELLEVVEWDGQESATVEVVGIDPALLAGSRAEVTIGVPRRRAEGATDDLVDVVLLDWIEVEYPHRARLRDGELRIEVADPAGGELLLKSATALPLSVYSLSGTRWRAPHMAFAADGDGATYRLALPAEPGRLYALVDAEPREPLAVERRPLAGLLDPTRQADYLMVVHPRLREAIEPLAELHRARGLTVTVVDTQQVYDELNHGILSPTAIRDLVDFAYHRWARPAPRFVLLVGDASWDTKNPVPDDEAYADWTYRPGERTRFGKNTSYAYGADVDPGHRNLVPTWSYESYEGHAASDNAFVAVDGDDFHPDLAIGRLPVTTPEEVAAIVAKTIRYVRQPAVGPWRRDVLWITNDQPSSQRRSDGLASELLDGGFAAHRIYPQAEEPSNEAHQRQLLQALDHGQLLVHFFGHGGRYIWRTGPPDFKKNHDLFTLDHLDQLAASDRLPVVLSMTCYSAPFDHPTADSIGEKFLRLADRGAIAVLAASWRNSPSIQFSRDLLEQLTTPGGTIGEAIQRAKQAQRNRTMVEMYNLLGDPAVPLALPQARVELELAAESPGAVEVELPFPSFHGEALIEWRDEQGGVVAEVRHPLAARRLEAAYPGDAGSWETVRSVSVYAWDEEQGIDALGVAAIGTASEPEPVAPHAGR